MKQLSGCVRTLGVVCTVLAAIATSLSQSPTPAHAGPPGIRYVTATPSDQTHIVGENTQIFVEAFNSDNDPVNSAITVIVRGVNNFMVTRHTPFTFSYSSQEPGYDTVRFQSLHLVTTPLTSASVGVTWKALVAGGSAVRLNKNAGNPAGGAVIFECDGQSRGASQVSITSCTAGGVSAPRVTSPGPAAVTAGTFTVDSAENVEVCWTVVAEHSSGPLTDTGCDMESV